MSAKIITEDSLETNRIYNMRFQDGLKDIPHVDMIITDPPYNINFKYGKYEDNKSEQEYIEMISLLKDYPLAIIHYPEETMRYFVPALGAPEEVIVWCYNSNLPRQSRLINFYNCKVDFNKVKQPYKNPNDKRVKKLIEKGSEGTRSYDWFSDIQLVKNVSKQKNHPCPIPVELVERIIKMTTPEGGVVLDPFMGGGTTAIACMNTGRKYIGFEIDPKYFAMAQERISKHLEGATA